MEYTRRIINGYKIHIEEPQTRGKNITIEYLCDGEFFTQSKYKNVDEISLKKIKDKLFDNTVYNLNVKEECQAIDFITIVFQIEDIIFKRKK